MADERNITLTDLGEEISTSLSAGVTFLTSGNTKRALAHLNLAAEIASDLGVSTPGVDASGLDLSATEKRRLSITDPNLLQLCANVYYYRAVALQQLRGYSESVKCYKLCVNLSLKTQDHYFAAMCFVGLAECYQELGDVSNEIRSWESARHLYKDMGDAGNVALVCAGLARAYLSSGQGEVCLQYIRESRRVCQMVPNKHSKGELLFEYGWIYSRMRMFAEALVCLKQALTLLCRDGRLTASILQNIGAVYNEMELFPEALDYHQQAADQYEKLHNKASSQCKCLCNLAFAQSQLGDFPNATRSYSKALSKAHSTSDNHLVFQASEGLGAVHFSMGRLTEAEHFFKEALSSLDCIESDTGLARERVMEKLSCVVEANKNESRQDNVLFEEPKRVKRLDSVDADLTAYMISYIRTSSSETGMEVTTPPHTPLQVKEGSLALGPKTRELFTTVKLSEGPYSSKATTTEIVSLDEVQNHPTSIHSSNTGSTVCTIV